MSLDIEVVVNGEVVWDHNVTHNLHALAKQVSLYKPLWKGEVDSDGLVPMLLDGIVLLEKAIKNGTDQEFLPENGWGTSQNLLSAAKDLVVALAIHPTGEVKRYV